ncbi:unnamed protein product [Diamesa serratosioi]
MLFMACFITYMLRVNISINIIAMVKDTTVINVNNTNISLPDYGERFAWSKREQSLVLGAYFWGYLVTSLFGGIMAERFGGKGVVGMSMLLSGFVTGTTPYLAQDSFWFLFASRFVLGVLGGVIYPALHNLVSKWAPPDEKGKFVSALLGGAFGTVVTWAMSGVIIEKIGWKYAFYIPAFMTFFLTALWYYLVADTPQEHPRITKEEKDYIEASLGGSVTKTKQNPPIGSILSSIPFYALLILHYGSLWGLYFLLTAAPKFMTEVLEFNLSKAGFLASLPYLARLLSGFAFGGVGDFLRKKNTFHVTTIRKSFCLFSHIIPGLFLIGLCFVGFNAYVCVAVITLSLGFNGAATMTNLQNSQDLAPNFAGSLYGIINFVGTTSGFISPVLVAHFTAQRSTMDEWQYVFYIGAAVYIVPALFFILFGSGEVQKWNEKKDDKEVEAENN